jgi:hypothetical protein
MTRLLVFWAANLSLVLVLGCSGAEKPVEVKGTVHCDGKPLAEGMITFITPGIPGDTMNIKDGAFAGRARAGQDRRVEVYAFKEGPPHKDPMTGEMLKGTISIVAPSFNSESKLKATIIEGGENSFHFDVASR